MTPSTLSGPSLGTVLGICNLKLILAEPKTCVMVSVVYLFCLVVYLFLFSSGNLQCSFLCWFKKKKIIVYFKLVMPLTCDPERIWQLFVLLKKNFHKVWGSGEEREKAQVWENNLFKLFIFSFLSHKTNTQLIDYLDSSCLWVNHTLPHLSLFPLLPSVFVISPTGEGRKNSN